MSARVPPVHLHIDELVFAGFAPGERNRLHDAVAGALAELLARGALPLPKERGSFALDAVPPQTVRLAGAAAGSLSTSRLGVPIAQAIVGACARTHEVK